MSAPRSGALHWRVPPLASCSGRVVDDRAVPLSGARVAVVGGGYGGRTDADGRFTFPAPDLEGLFIEACLEGHASRSRSLADLGDRKALELVLPRTTPLALSVRVPEGAAVPKRDPEASWPGWRPSSAPGAWTRDGPFLPFEAAVDPDAPWLAVDARGFRPLVWRLDAEPATPLELPTRTLDPGSTLEGSLLDAAGQGVDGLRTWHPLFELPRYRVAVYQHPHPLAPEGALRRVDATLDAHGHWRATGLVPGPAIVHVEVDLEGWLRLEVEVEPDGRPCEIRLPPPATVSGRVVDAEGRPQCFATVRLHRLLPPDPRANAAEQLLREIPTDSGGRFLLEGPPGSYRVEVVDEAPWPHEDTVRATRLLDLEQGGSREVELTLADPAATRPSPRR